MLIPFLRLLKPRLINKVISNIKLAFNPDYKEEIEIKSTNQFERIINRKADQDDKIQEYQQFCRKYSKPICNEKFLMRFGKKPVDEQTFFRNQMKISQLKYMQLSIVLSSKMAFMTEDEVKELKLKYVTQAKKLIDQQKKF